MLALLSAVCFLLVVLGAAIGGLNLTALGLLLLALAVLFGNWPFGPVGSTFFPRRAGE